MGWQWHLMQIICTSLQTDNHTSTVPHHSVFTGWMPFLPPNQQHQSTEGLCMLVYIFTYGYISVDRQCILALNTLCVRMLGHAHIDFVLVCFTCSNHHIFV